MRRRPVFGFYFKTTKRLRRDTTDSAPLRLCAKHILVRIGSGLLRRCAPRNDEEDLVTRVALTEYVHVAGVLGIGAVLVGAAGAI